MLMASAFDCMFGVGAFNFAYLSSNWIRCLSSSLAIFSTLISVCAIGIYLLVFDGLQYSLTRIQENMEVSLVFLDGTL